MWSLTFILLASYLLGSVPGALWASQALHSVDIRNHGSHNCGATNAFRVVGWKAGMLATLVDFGKGFLAAGVVAPMVRLDPLPPIEVLGGEVGTVVGLLAGLAAVIGHMYPVFARFEGGKGVNTAAGMLFALTPLTMALTLGVFVAVLLIGRYVSLASISAALAFPTLVALRRYALDAPIDVSLLVFGTVLALAIVVAHRSNIRRLLNGTESRISSFQPAQGMRGRGEL